LSISYDVISGDTFELVARKKYGSEQYSDIITAANPGVKEPLTAGTTLIIPALPGAPLVSLQNKATDTLDEVALSIDGERFRFWTGITISRSMDSLDSIEFNAPFEPENTTFREKFRPLSYKDVTFTVGGEPLFTGTMLTPVPDSTAEDRTVSVTAYSLPGVLNDCTPPVSAFPLEFNGQGLREIAATLAKPFGISVEFTADQGATFKRVATEPEKKIFDFLSELAGQRNLIISSTPRGALLFQRSTAAGQPVARLREGDAPLLSVRPNFKPQGYYSHITGLRGARVGKAGSSYTVANPRLKGAIRPFIYKVEDTDGADLKSAVEAKAGRMFASAVSYTASALSWRSPSGQLWAPNTTVKLTAPGAMIYNEYEFLIRSVSLTRAADNELAELTLVLPGSFEGKAPEAMPWD